MKTQNHTSPPRQKIQKQRFLPQHFQEPTTTKHNSIKKPKLHRETEKSITIEKKPRNQKKSERTGF